MNVIKFISIKMLNSILYFFFIIECVKIEKTYLHRSADGRHFVYHLGMSRTHKHISRIFPKYFPTVVTGKGQC